MRLKIYRLVFITINKIWIYFVSSFSKYLEKKYKVEAPEFLESIEFPRYLLEYDIRKEFIEEQVNEYFSCEPYVEY